jgi:hypothetical protein
MALDVEEASDQSPPLIDPRVPTIISVFGKRRSGKSTVNRALYNGYPGDKICIDVNGDADPGGDDLEPITGDLPTHMPPRRDGKRRNLYYRADPGSPTYVDDLDRALGLALYPQDRPTMVWCGEVGEFCKGGRSGPHMRRLLHQNSHYAATVLFDGPRPIDIDKLVIAQAQHVIMFRMPDPDDRKHTAKVMGVPPADLEEAHDELVRRGPYWWLHYASDGDQLYLHPPLQLPRKTAQA